MLCRNIFSIILLSLLLMHNLISAEMYEIDSDRSPTKIGMSDANEIDSSYPHIYFSMYLTLEVCPVEYVAKFVYNNFHCYLPYAFFWREYNPSLMQIPNHESDEYNGVFFNYTGKIIKENEDFSQLVLKIETEDI